jgi:hypothetical protein
MILAGSGGALLSHAARGRILRLAALCVIAAGLITIARGAGLIHVSPHITSGTPSHASTTGGTFCW